MGNWSPDEIRDTPAAGQLASQFTPTRTAEAINSHVVGSDASHYLSDAESTRFDPHDLSGSLDTDTSLDDQEHDGERDVSNHSDLPDDSDVKQGTDSEREESSLETSSVSGASEGVWHHSAGIDEGTAAPATLSEDSGIVDWTHNVEKSERALELKLQETRSITISDDLSHISKIEERQFLALRAPALRAPSLHVPYLTQFQRAAIQQHYVAQREAAQRKAARYATKLPSPPMPPVESFKHTSIQREHERIPMQAQTDRKTMDAMQSWTVGGPSNTDGLQTSLKRRLSDSEPELDDHILGLDLVGLQKYIGRLSKRATHLNMSSVSKSQPTHRHLTLYRIQSYKKASESRHNLLGSLEMAHSAPFLDAPEWIGTVDRGRLHCKVPIQNFDLFLEKNKDIAFIVFKTYSARHPGPDSIALETDDTPDITVNESIKPITKELVEAVRLLLGSQDEYADLWHDFKATSELRAPYLFIFHQRGYIDTDATSTNAKQASHEQLTMLWNYIIQKHGDVYTTADSLFSRGEVTSDCVQYLFKPGDILVQQRTDSCLGWVAKSWAKHVETYRTTREKAKAIIARTSQIPLYGTRTASKGMVNERIWVQNWEIPAWNWDFDGSFQRRHDEISFSIVTEDDPGPGPGIIYAFRSRAEDAACTPESMPISDLEVFPIRYAPQEVVQQLRRRGKAFWKCRNRKLVSYEEHAKDSQESMLEERYMVDLKAYRTLHKSNQFAIGATSELQDELGPEAMAKEEPPDDRFELLLPPTIKGFNMRRKKWFDLVAEHITDVEWNEDAFRKVVMNSKAKDLIQALVSSQLASEASTDLIENKGNGLILLLHGGPGTGKTLTAEGVAEITKKPLYRVTCADIGTKAEDAEKYLESILHLGKLWRCVVLLDEADVFLEQRSLEDLKRNSLVSVFLRVLEYYEGILILTSNRVGTFDEAFKSRIQLALHYPALGPYERLRIWENFFERLEKLKDPSIDVPDLRDHLKELQVEEMNGRQIRNAITTARQYAKWKNVTLMYTHLKDVIDVAGRFDKYLDQLHGGRTQDQLAEEEGVR